MRGDIEGVLAGWHPRSCVSTSRGTSTRLPSSTSASTRLLDQGNLALTFGRYSVCEGETVIDKGIFCISEVEGEKLVSWEAFEHVGEAFHEFRATTLWQTCNELKHPGIRGGLRVSNAESLPCRRFMTSCEKVMTRPTKPKVTGSNPVGRARLLSRRTVSAGSLGGAGSSAARFLASFLICFSCRRSISFRSRLSFAIVVFLLPLEAMSGSRA